MISKLSEKKGTYVKLGKMKNPSMRIKKYSPFVDIDIRKYKKYLIENV